MEEWVTQFVGTVGVPATLCFYVMGTMKKAVEANTKAITLLSAKLGVDMKEVN